MKSRFPFFEPQPTRRKVISLFMNAAIIVGAFIFLKLAFGRMVAANSDTHDLNAQGPIALVDETERTIGVVENNQVVSVSFRVKNAGDRRLILRERLAECDCLPSDGETILVAPGERFELPVVFSAFAPDRETTECFARRFETNDARLPLLEFKVKYSIR